jgi:hypothetical protein
MVVLVLQYLDEAADKLQEELLQVRLYMVNSVSAELMLLMEAVLVEVDMVVDTVTVQEQTPEAEVVLDESTQKTRMKTELIIQPKVDQEIDS